MSSNALLTFIQLFLVVKTLESIISLPLVQRSREANLPMWLLLPIFGCITMGLLYSFSNTSGLNTRTEAQNEAAWLGPLFISAGGKPSARLDGLHFVHCHQCPRSLSLSHTHTHTTTTTTTLSLALSTITSPGLFFVFAISAWLLKSFPILNIRDKKRKSVIIVGLIVISFSLLVMLTTIFSASIAFSLSLEELPITEALRGDIACFIDQSGSCTNCESEKDRCPEWSREDVTKILQSQAKAGAALAAIFLAYAASSLRHAFNLRSHIINYQIDYV